MSALSRKLLATGCLVLLLCYTAVSAHAATHFSDDASACDICVSFGHAADVDASNSERTLHVSGLTIDHAVQSTRLARSAYLAAPPRGPPGLI